RAASIHVNKNYWLTRMRLGLCVRTFEFNRLLGRKRQRIDGSAQNVFSCVLVEFAAVLRQLHQLRLVLVGVEQKDASAIGQVQARSSHGWRWLGRICFFGSFFHHFCTQTSPLFVVFLGGCPVHQLVGQLLPYVALGAVITHTVAMHFSLGDVLERSIFQDEALRVLLRECRE